MDTWLGVELRHLAALAAVAEERSFHGAADRLGYVQSAVSQRISQLEQIVGVRLVERARGHRHVALTEAGDALLHHAKRIQTQMTAARADLRSLTEAGKSSRLEVGVFDSLATRLLPMALALLADREPELRVEVREGPSDDEHFAAVQTGKLDAAFGELPLEAGPFEWREVLIDPLVLLVPAASPLAARDSAPELAEIAERPLVVDPTWRLFGLIEAEFAAAGLELDTRHQATSNTALQAFVGAGLGVAITPRLTVEPNNPATTAIDLDGVLPPRKLVLYWPQGRQLAPALQAFLHAIQAVTAPLRQAAGVPIIGTDRLAA